MLLCGIFSTEINGNKLGPAIEDIKSPKNGKRNFSISFVRGNNFDTAQVIWLKLTRTYNIHP